MSESIPCNRLIAVVIDDDAAHRDLIGRSVEAAFADGAVEILAYADADEALVDLPAQGRVVILCDNQLGGVSGVDWLPDFIRADVGPVIIVTSSGNERIVTEAFRHGAADFIDKARLFESPEELRKAINGALRRHKLEHTNRELARRLRLANDTLKRKNVILGEMTETAHRFVDDVAHEFRTPLTVITEFASILSDGIGGEVTEQQAEYLQFITRASRDLAHLIDDFLDSSKLRAGTLRVERREHAIVDLLDSIWPMIESRAGDKDILVERKLEGDLPTVFVDADKVRRSIINLVINAIKFSKPGGTVAIAARSVDPGRVEIGVTDRGPGLCEEEMQQLFERFRQGGESGRISAKGFGLGLNIVKELVAINLGEVSVSSTLGEGSTFSFTMPSCDVRHVLDSFTQRTMEQTPSATIAVLCARRVSPKADLDELRSFVANVCYPTDVQFSGTDERSVIIAGETTEPDRWVHRLLRHDERNTMHALGAEHPGQLRVDHLGSWMLRDVKEALLGILDAPMEARHCA
jgi:signal transduction histidine kinase